MHLTKLDIQGFKSFADRTVLEFDRTIASIVGPNGSGKSNIADALRWVLGEQSMKNLRGKRSEDIIFGGSKNRKRLNLARVEITLDNRDGQGALDFPEIVISRKMDRSGESEFRINGNPAKLQDIVMFLAKSNFGQKSYAIIGQGMIERIVNATPETRKDFFDEATGVKSLQIKRDASVNKLIRTEEHLMQIEALLHEIEPRLRSLKRQIKKLERREKIEAELQDVHIRYYGSQWHDIANKTHALRNEQKKLNTQKEKLRADIAKLQRDSDNLANDTSVLDKQKRLSAQLSALESKKNNLLKQQVIVKGRLEIEHEKHGGSHLAWLEKHTQELETKIRDLEKEKTVLEQQHAACRKRVQESEAELQRFSKKTKDAEYKLLKTREAANSPKDLPLPKLREQLATLYGHYEDLLERLIKLRDMGKIAELRSYAKSITLEFAELLDQLEEHDHEKYSREADILQQQLKTHLDRKEHLIAKVHEHRANEQRLAAQLDFLNKERQSTKAAYDNTVRELTTARNNTSDDATHHARRAQQEYDRLEKEIIAIDNEIQKIQKELSAYQAEEQNTREQIISYQQQARGAQNDLNVVTQKAQEVAVELARLETRTEDLTNEINLEAIRNNWELIKNFRPAAGEARIEELGATAQRLKKQLELIGGIDPETVKEHDETAERFAFLSREATDLREAVASLHKVIDALDKTIKTQFREAFKEINKDFKKYFNTLFDGGESSLELLQQEPEPEETQDADDTEKQTTTDDTEPRVPESLKIKKRKIISGIDIRVHPPGKKITNISMLSGGEKSLVAIALISAILHTNPSPFVILDEVEAALDEANSARFAEILKDLNKQTQFILITHNREVMKQSNILYGVTMDTDSVSKILSVKMDELSDKQIGRAAQKS